MAMAPVSMAIAQTVDPAQLATGLSTNPLSWFLVLNIGALGFAVRHIVALYARIDALQVEQLQEERKRSAEARDDRNEVMSVVKLVLGDGLGAVTQSLKSLTQKD